MLKLGRLTTIISLLLLSFFTASRLAAQSPTDSLACYMQTADGRTVNLGDLCKQNTPSINPQKLSAVDAEAARMPISSVKYDGNLLEGRVTNQTGDTVQNIKVNYEVRDRKGNLIDNGFILAQPATVPPGASASFSGVTAKGTKVQPTFVEWSK